MVNRQAPSLDATFSALADPIRRGIIERLCHGEATVGDLAAPFPVSAPAISRHLRVLERAGLMERQRRGRVHHCRLKPEAIDQASHWLRETRKFWEDTFDRLASYLEQTEQGSDNKE